MMRRHPAIETHYKGYRFRSRLEARWAIFFDTLGCPWEYEAEGFNVHGTRYLPDFWLPTLDCYAEVKPKPFTAREQALATACRCLLLDGTPAVRWYTYAYPVDPDDPDDPHWDEVHLPYSVHKERLWFACGEDLTGYNGYYNDVFQRAVVAARSARFEHGERP